MARVRTISQVRPGGEAEILALLLENGTYTYQDGPVTCEVALPVRETETILEVREGYVLIWTPFLELAVPIEDVIDAVFPYVKSDLRRHLEETDRKRRRRK
jgi:hypothetical protein